MAKYVQSLLTFSYVLFFSEILARWGQFKWHCEETLCDIQLSSPIFFIYLMFNFPNLLLSSSTWSTSSCETKGTFRIALCRATGPRVLCQDICQWKNSLIVLKDGVVLPEWPLQTEISVSATFRVYLFHIETVEQDTSTYDWIKLSSNC